MASSLSLPPRHTRAHFEALAREPLSRRDRCLILGILALASWAIVGFCATLAGL